MGNWNLRKVFIGGLIGIGLFIVILNFINIFKDVNASLSDVPEGRIPEMIRNEGDNPFWTTLEKRVMELEKDGEVCKDITDTIEKGDCYQEVLSSYLVWYLDRSTFDDYSDIHFIEENEWKDILYAEIKDDDRFYYSFIDQDAETDDLDLLEEIYWQDIEWLTEHWTVFSYIIPKQYRMSLKSVYWGDSGKDTFFAVSRDYYDPKTLSLMISRKNYGYQSEYKSYYIHEFAHMLTLSEDQVKVDEDIYLSGDPDREYEASRACKTYYQWGCMEEDSYLNQFYHQFWWDLVVPFKNIITEEDLIEFYNRHQDRFLNAYSATDPAEDIAECFVFFVMQNSNELDGKTEMKYDKIRFLYQYDELVTMRTEILENIYELVVLDKWFY